MQSEGNANHFISIGLNFGILILCIFPTWIVLRELEGSHEGLVEGQMAGAMAGLGDAGGVGVTKGENEDNEPLR
jgi:hypothetical protein